MARSQSDLGRSLQPPFQRLSQYHGQVSERRSRCHTQSLYRNRENRIGRSTENGFQSAAPAIRPFCRREPTRTPVALLLSVPNRQAAFARYDQQTGARHFQPVNDQSEVHQQAEQHLRRHLRCRWSYQNERIRSKFSPYAERTPSDEWPFRPLGPRRQSPTDQASRHAPL